MISGNYLGVTTLGDVGTTHTELMLQQCISLLHYIVSHKEHPWNLLAKVFSQRRRKIRKCWPHSSSVALSGHMTGVHLNLLHLMKTI